MQSPCPSSARCELAITSARLLCVQWTDSVQCFTRVAAVWRSTGARRIPTHEIDLGDLATAS